MLTALFDCLQNWAFAGPDLTYQMQKTVKTMNEIRAVLDDVLGLRGRAAGFTPDTALLGAIPELDSMAVVAVLTAIEERFGLAVADDEIDGSTFRTFGSLVAFVEQKLAG